MRIIPEPQDICGRDLMSPESSLALPADQKTRGLWVRDWEKSRYTVKRVPLTENWWRALFVARNYILHGMVFGK